MKRFYRSFSLPSAILAALFAGHSAFASVVDLGDASGFAVLATDGNLTSSDSAFQGNIGVAASGFSYSQAGGSETDLQQPITAYINSGSTVGTVPPAVTVNQSSDAFLAQAVSDAKTASTNLANLTSTGNLGNITSAQTVTESAVGNYVFSVGTINLSQAALTLSAPAGSTFVLNIYNGVTLNGAGLPGTGILVSGGLSSRDVVFNVLNGGSVSTTGIGSSQDIQGTILALGGAVSLDSAEVDGQVIAESFSSGRVTNVSPGPLNAIPEYNAGFVLAALSPLMLLITPSRIRRTLAALGSRGAVSGMA